MARYPRGMWRRLPGDEPAIRPTTGIFHTMVGTLPSVDDYFRSGRSGGIESHFGVGGPWEGTHYDGLVYQWRDTREQADANFRANGFGVSIETSDGGDPDRPWSPKQVDALVDLGRWLAAEEKIPRRICPAWNAGGFGWHTMWGAPSEWTPVSKTCPGPVRIRQLQQIVLPAIFADHPPEEDDVTEQDLNRIFTRIEEAERRVARYVDHGDAAVTGSGNHHAHLLAELATIRDAVQGGVTVTLDLSQASPTQLADLGKAIAEHMHLLGHPTLTITGTAVPSVLSVPPEGAP
jgi:hypothetical protein